MQTAAFEHGDHWLHIVIPEPIPMPILLPAKADFVSIDIQAGCYKVIP